MVGSTRSDFQRAKLHAVTRIHELHKIAHQCGKNMTKSRPTQQKGLKSPKRKPVSPSTCGGFESAREGKQHGMRFHPLHSHSKTHDRH
jgi:hypothetical protein